MVHAAAAGAVDFASADPRDRRWRLGLELRLDALERRDHARVVALWHARQVALLANPRLTDESFRSCGEAARDLADMAEDLTAPWRRKRRAAAQAGADKMLGERWEEIFGAMGAPETEAAIDATLAALEAAYQPDAGY